MGVAWYFSLLGALRKWDTRCGFVSKSFDSASFAERRRSKARLEEALMKHKTRRFGRRTLSIVSPVRRSLRVECERKAEVGRTALSFPHPNLSWHPHHY